MLFCFINYGLGKNSKITVFSSTDSKLIRLDNKTRIACFRLAHKTKICYYCLADKTIIAYNGFNKGRNHYEQRYIKANND